MAQSSGPARAPTGSMRWRARADSCGHSRDRPVCPLCRHSPTGPRPISVETFTSTETFTRYSRQMLRLRKSFRINLLSRRRWPSSHPHSSAPANRGSVSEPGQGTGPQTRRPAQSPAGPLRVSVGEKSFEAGFGHHRGEKRGRRGRARARSGRPIGFNRTPDSARATPAAPATSQPARPRGTSPGSGTPTGGRGPRRRCGPGSRRRPWPRPRSPRPSRPPAGACAPRSGREW